MWIFGKKLNHSKTSINDQDLKNHLTYTVELNS